MAGIGAGHFKLRQGAGLPVSYKRSAIRTLGKRQTCHRKLLLPRKNTIDKMRLCRTDAEKL